MIQGGAASSFNTNQCLDETITKTVCGSASYPLGTCLTIGTNSVPVIHVAYLDTRSLVQNGTGQSRRHEADQARLSHLMFFLRASFLSLHYRFALLLTTEYAESVMSS